MRDHDCRASVLVAALILLQGARGDEPTRPTEPASEANPAVPAAGHSVHGEAFDDGPRHHASLMPGMGKVHFPVTTARPEAQAFIDQGVAQLHSFYYFEAERSFRQAAAIDPDCAMAYWGMAMANVKNGRRAGGSSRRRGSATPSSPRARSSTSTRSRRSTRTASTTRRASRTTCSASRPSSRSSPATSMPAPGWRWSPGRTGRSAAGRRSTSCIDSVLQVEPMHPGAHHYRIHLWDDVKPIRAEKSAALYAKAAPGIAHAWHMPGHTYTGLKRYADAAYQQEGSARVDHAYMIRDRIMPFEIHNYAHNNQWLCTSLSHIGRARDAIAVARNLVEQPRDPNKNGKNDGGSAQRSGRLRWVEVLTRYELWDDLIAATTSGALDWSDLAAERKEKAYTLGLAYAAKGDQAKLAEQVAALEGAGSRRGQGRLPVVPEPRPQPGRPGRAGGLSAPRPGRGRPRLRTLRQGDRHAPRGAGPRPPGREELRPRREHRPRSRREAAEPGPSARRAGRGPPRRRQGHGGAGSLSQARADGPPRRPRPARLPTPGAGRRRLDAGQGAARPRQPSRRPTTPRSSGST